MAPKRRPQNVVRSGNAGNSSKPTPAKSKADEAVPDGPPRPPPLFPPGYKTPLSMLYEKCQKAGWEKPLVDTVSAAGARASTSVELGSAVREGSMRLHSYRLESSS